MAENACNLITASIKKSCLNYQIQETTYSIYVTIRKTFLKSKPSSPSDESPVTPVKSEKEDLQKNCDSLKAKCEEVVNENGMRYNRMNKNATTTQELVEIKTKFDKLSAKVNIEAKMKLEKIRKMPKKN